MAAVAPPRHRVAARQGASYSHWLGKALLPLLARPSPPRRVELAPAACRVAIPGIG